MATTVVNAYNLGESLQPLKIRCIQPWRMTTTVVNAYNLGEWLQPLDDYVLGRYTQRQRMTQPCKVYTT